MKQVYVNNGGEKIPVVVTDEIENALKQTRRAIWRNDSYARRHYEVSFDAMTDKDEWAAKEELNPETIFIAAEERTELRAKLTAALKLLTPQQFMLVKMLYRGMSVIKIAAKLGIGKAAVSNMRKRIQEKIKKQLQ